MKPFYTNVESTFGKILYRGIDSSGKRISAKIDHQPTIFVNCNDTTKDQGWRTIKGQMVAPFVAGDIVETREFIKKHRELEDFPIYGMTSFEYEYIATEFPDDMTKVFDKTKLVVGYIDIEVASENCFPDIYRADQRVTAITYYTERLGFRAFGCGDYTPSASDVTYTKCADEVELIMRFLDVWKRDYPDIITGWNIKFFDIPYLVNRISRLLDDKHATMLSPWGKLNTSEKTINGKDALSFGILGVATLDYLDLYKKFGPPGSRESYKLNYIASLEIGEKKISYDEFDSLLDLYTKDFQKFIDYNVHDVRLIQKLEVKLRLIELALFLAYKTKVNYEDVFSQTRMWDGLIHSYLLARKIVIPQKKVNDKPYAYEGAYVKDPQLGQHDDVVCFDFTSLYPRLMMQYNISPECIVDAVDWPNDLKVRLLNTTINVDTLLDKPLDSLVHNSLVTHKLGMTANKQLFRNDTLGFLPEILEGLFDERVINKKKALTAKKELERIKHERERRKNG